MAKTQIEQVIEESMENETEETKVNYTGAANLKQIALAVAKYTLGDEGLDEWIQATAKAIRATTQRGLPLSEQLQAANDELDGIYGNPVMLTNNKPSYSVEQKAEQRRLLTKIAQIEAKIEKENALNEPAETA